MANFKAGVPNGSVTGNSDFMPSNENWNGTFWSNGWGATEAVPKDGKGVSSMPSMRGGSTAGNMSQKTGSRHGKCPYCG